MMVGSSLNEIAPGNARAAGYPAQTQPRELGMLQRLDGVRGGLSEISGRLESFMSKLQGHPPSPTQAGATPNYPPGILGCVSESEDTVRRVIDMLSRLDEAF